MSHQKWCIVQLIDSKNNIKLNDGSKIIILNSSWFDGDNKYGIFEESFRPDSNEEIATNDFQLASFCMYLSTGILRYSNIGERINDIIEYY